MIERQRALKTEVSELAKKKKEEEAAPGAPAWMATFSDLMNLLLCFFVLLFSMATIEEDKFEAVAASLAQAFSVFSGGAQAIGDGMLISNGVSQLNELSEYVSSMGLTAEGEMDNAMDEFKEEQTKESEELAEKINEAVVEQNLEEEIDVDFTSQYVLLTMNGALLFDSGRDVLKEEAYPVLQKVGEILERYATNVIEVEGHTDNVPIHNSRFASNDELSSFRALAMFHYLVENTNLDPALIKHSGRGEYIPVTDNGTPEGRAKNRRVEIKIYHDLSM